MPAGHDPDSLVREEGAGRLREVVAGARPFFDFHLDYLCGRHDAGTDTGRVQISRALAESLAKVDNAVLRATYLQRSAARLGVPEAALREELAKVRRRVGPVAPEPVAPEQPAVLPAERMLLQLTLGCPETLAPALEALDPRWLTDSIAGGMLAAIGRLHAAGAWRGEEQLLDEFPDAQDLLAGLLVDFRPPADPAAAAMDCVRALEKRWKQGRREALRRQLAQPGLALEEVARIQKQILDLK